MSTVNVGFPTQSLTLRIGYLEPKIREKLIVGDTIGLTNLTTIDFE